MTGINQFLKEKLKEMGGSTYIAPEIDENKLSNAINSFQLDSDATSIIGICDSTLFKSAKEGFLLTGRKIVYKTTFIDPVEILYEELMSVEYIELFETNEKGKESKKEFLQFNKKNGAEIKITPVSSIDFIKLAEILKKVINDFGNYEEQNQLQPIEELSEKLKVAYIQVIVNMAFENDGEVDDNEFSEILQLMTRLKLNAESRSMIRQYIGGFKNTQPLERLIKIIDAYSPDGMLKSLHISLVKDLISVNSSLTNNTSSDFDFIQKNRDIFKVSDEEIELAKMAIANDMKILDRTCTDKAMTQSLKELSAQAAAVGVPLGVVYLSGSVLGLSAAGMTSGLATLGMGGALGFSSMATGIGAAVVLGLLSYKGVQYLTRTDTDEGDKRRDLMFQEIIRQTQRTMNMVIDDINVLTNDLTSALAAEQVTRSGLGQLTVKLFQYVRAAKVIGTKAAQAEADRQRLKSPEFLDLDRLKVLTQDHDKRKYCDFVMRFYQDEIIHKKGKDGALKEIKTLRLIKSDDARGFEQLGQVFELLDYASTGSALKGKWKGMFS